MNKLNFLQVDNVNIFYSILLTMSTSNFSVLSNRLNYNIDMEKRESQTKAKKRYHHGSLRESLIAAGIEILEEEDIHGLSLRKVAKRANVSHAAPYRHFEDKIALLSAIAEQGFKELGKGMGQTMSANAQDPRQQLLEIGHFYVGFAIAHPAQLTLMFSDLLKGSTSETLTEAASYTFTLLTQAVANAQAAEVIKPGNSDQIARTVWAMEHGLAMLMKEGFFDDEVVEIRNRTITESLEHLLDGLAP